MIVERRLINFKVYNQKLMVEDYLVRITSMTNQLLLRVLSSGDILYPNLNNHIFHFKFIKILL